MEEKLLKISAATIDRILSPEKKKLTLKNRSKTKSYTGFSKRRISLHSLPFPLLGIDLSFGSEFINAHFLRYCQENKITFTRSRPFKKNDNCYVKQKNYSAVRRFVGYLRHDTEEELEILKRFYQVLRLYLNFFQPCTKLISKERVGGLILQNFIET